MIEVNDNELKLEDIITRIGIARSQANLSARELSLLIDKTPSYINKLETSGFNLTVQTLLDIIRACNISVEQFFYHDIQSYKKDIEILNLLKNCSETKKTAILMLLQA